MTERRSGGFRPLFSEMNALYASSRERPNTIRVRIRMRDAVDGEALRLSVAETMKRYPYFCVELQRRRGKLGFAENSRPVTVAHAQAGMILNAEASNYHLIAFSWQADWIIMDVSHALTDGTGATEVVRTLLHCYCTRRYGAQISSEGVRLPGDAVPAGEWEDPSARVTDEPPETEGGEGIPALDPVALSGLQGDTRKTVFTASVAEDEFMRFNRDNDGSPATMTALLLSRAIAGLHPDCRNPIRISVCVNLRKALHAPLAHQSLVGGAWLEFNGRVRAFPLDRQATAYRGMVMVRTIEENVLTDVTYINRNTRRLLAAATDAERVRQSEETGEALRHALTATVSYVGRANLGGAEQYVRDYHLWANAMYENLLVEISAVNGRFIFDFIQNFSSDIYWRAFLRQLSDNGVAWEEQAAAPLELSAIRLPWIR